MDDFLSLTELGKMYGVSSHKIGKWLRDLGLRTEEGRPSRMAFSGGFVAQRPSRGIGTYYYVWNASKTRELFDEKGCRLAGQE